MRRKFDEGRTEQTSDNGLLMPVENKVYGGRTPLQAPANLLSSSTLEFHYFVLVALFCFCSNQSFQKTQADWQLLSLA